jgi:HEAT repeat protein
VRKFAAKALQVIPDEHALSTLIQALTDEYSDVRKEAAIALGVLAHPAALNPLQQALDDPDRDVAIYSQRAIDAIQQVEQNV